MPKTSPIIPKTILKKCKIAKKSTQIFRIFAPRCVKYDEFFIHGIKVLLIDSGLGRDEFLGEAQAQITRREASTQSILDFLDTFSIANYAAETLNRSKIALE